MGLEKVFSQVENPPEEKKLQVIASEEAIINDWLDYFDKTKKENSWETTDYSLRPYFLGSQTFLQSYKIHPQMITKFNETLIGKKLDCVPNHYFGVLLSALIQVSYYQGHNTFEFDEINATCFGAFLEGKRNERIKIKSKTVGYQSLYKANNCILTLTAEEVDIALSLWFAQNSSLNAKMVNGNGNLSDANSCSITADRIKGNGTLYAAKNCFAEIGIINGDGTLAATQDCSLLAQMINGARTLEYAKNCNLKVNTLKGDYSLVHADKCITQITAYEGESFGGSWYYGRMVNCGVCSPNQVVLDKIKNQVEHGINNSFELKSS
ncbi:hypothetical protein HY643_04185 [Candidatus Woesearchaeota archaeon]|nr:hypothetical protein [Candidatus Woesearchaeota archaeon]